MRFSSRAPRGSMPTVGSSTMSMRGACTSAAAMIDATGTAVTMIVAMTATMTAVMRIAPAT